MSHLSRDNRVFVIDLLRGLFILLMLVSHSIFFFHAKSNQLLTTINWFGAFISFTGLLLASGAAGYIAYIHYRHPTQNIVRRLSRRIFSYLIWYYLLSVFASSVNSGFSSISLVQIITFRKLVPFTEFVVTLLIFALLKVPLRKLYNLLSGSLPLTFLAMSVSLLTAAFLRTADFLPAAYKLLLIGDQGSYSFPLLQYFPIYLLGINLGKTFWESKSDKHKITKCLKLTLLFFFITLSSILFFNNQFTSQANLLNRWPPSFTFLSGSLTVSLLILSLTLIADSLSKLPFLRILLLILGQNAFAVYFSHTFLLYFFKLSSFPQVHSLLLFLAYLLLSLFLSILLAKYLPFNYSFGLTFVDAYHLPFAWGFRSAEHYLITRLRNGIKKTFHLPNRLKFTLGGKTYKLMGLKNLLLALFLTLSAVIPLGVAENISFFEKSVNSLQGSVNRRWILTTAVNQQITYTITIPASIYQGQKKVAINYSLDGGELLKMSYKDDAWYSKIETSNLKPGTHHLVTEITIGKRSYKSQVADFYITAPLYVVWTIDWEGYDVDDRYLEALEQIASQYAMPMTQMFNPRIYTSAEIQPPRVEFLTDWVRKRKDFTGDEIGLHLHMFPDFVEASGISAKFEPVWGGGFTPGYDILTTAYNYREMKVILNYAKTLFQTQGLGIPRSYRAGAWFANLDTLQALADTGFLVDSSGRTKYSFGTKGISGFWDLKSVSQPYFPSQTNQNSSYPPPNLEILEIPNNGADSYAYTASEMIERFTDNYTGGVLQKPLQITFLSHPHWFNPERQNSMRQVFSHVNSYSYKDDLGPAVNSTLMEVYSIWIKN